MLFKMIKRVREEMKKENELHNALTRIAKIPLDYELLQTMINATADSPNAVTIKVSLKTGETIELIPASKKGVDFIPFKDKYANRNINK